MNGRALCAVLVWFGSSVLAADFKTLDGTQYKGVVVKRVEADGVVVETDVGVEKIYFNELPNEVRERYSGQAAAAAAAPASETRTTVATTSVPAQGSGHGVADTIASTVKAPATINGPAVIKIPAAVAPPTATPAQPLTPLH